MKEETIKEETSQEKTGNETKERKPRADFVPDEDMQKRLDAANFVLRTFAPETTISLAKSGHVEVSWTGYDGKKITKRWMTRGQSFYPPWYRNWAHGGTASTALSQLVRFVKGKPVLPISTWRYWAGDRVALLRQGERGKNGGPTGEEAVNALLSAGYPEQVNCVVCGLELGSRGFDWWALDGVSGPCCGIGTGCQERKS